MIGLAFRTALHAGELVTSHSSLIYKHAGIGEQSWCDLVLDIQRKGEAEWGFRLCKSREG